MEDGMEWMHQFHLSSKEIPELKDWKAGGKYDLQLQVEQIKSEKGVNGAMLGMFRVITAKSLGESGERDKLRQKFQSHGRY